MPRPKLKPDAAQRNLVKSLAACGIPHAQIARRVGIRSPKTLRKHFRQEIDEGVTEANYKVAKSLFESATSGDTNAAKFWLTHQAGWRPYTPYIQPGGSLPPFVVARDQE